MFDSTADDVNPVTIMHSAACPAGGDAAGFKRCLCLIVLPEEDKSHFRTLCPVSAF